MWRLTLDVAPPVVILLSLLNAKGYLFPVTQELYESHQIDRSHVLLPPVVLNSFAESPATIMRPLFEFAASVNVATSPRTHASNCCT